MKTEEENFRDVLLETLRTLMPIAERQRNNAMMKRLGMLQEIVFDLQRRSGQNQFPDAAVRITLNDARLDTLLLLADLKIELLYQHQEALAPTEQLRNQVRAHYEEMAFDGTEMTNDERRSTAEIEADLNVLREIENTLRQ
jgi:hypothetical protein